MSNFRNEKLFIVGLAFDFCVGKTALDAAELGFQVFVVKDLTRSTDLKSEQQMELQLKASHNISIITSNEITQILN
jgi:nicotinamidase-related amidase